MKNLLDSTIFQKLDLKPSSKVAIAVSGGKDSMVLIHLCLDFFKNITVLHCNFNLRGEESNKDEKLVRDFCSDHNISFYSKSFDTYRLMREESYGVQEAARHLRYSWFKEEKELRGFDFLFTGHHLDDDMETLLINLSRGSGIDGLAGIPQESSYIKRPLLQVSREVISEYAKNNNVPFRDDQSNFKDDYYRNAIRLNLIPEWEKYYSPLKKGLSKSINHLKEQKEYFDKQLLLLETKIRSERGILIKALLDEPKFLICLYLKRIGFNEDSQNNLFKLLEKDSTGKIIPGKKENILIDRDYLVLFSEENRIAEEHLIDRTTKNLLLQDFELEFNESQDYKPLATKKEEGIDLNKLSFPLKLRRWKKGDVFQPLGMKGIKKLSDFFIDSKISRKEKDNIWILESKGEIVWVLGHRMDDRFKIGKNSEKVYIVKIIEKHD